MLERIALVSLLAVAARAQEPAPAQQDPNVLLTKALQRLKAADTVSAAVEVEHAPPEADGAQQAVPGGMGMIVQTEIVGEQPPFAGRVEACRDADGTLVLLSERELPGFSLYVTDARTIERTTFEDERFALDQLRGELTALLDPEGFTRRILDAKLVPTRDAATGAITFRGKVDRDIVPATGGEMAFMQGRVLGAEATLVVTPDGGLSSATVRITRSDPAREMMRGGAMRRIAVMGGAPMPAADDDKKHDIVGGSTTYKLTFGRGGLSDRAKAFKAEAERLLKAPDHGNPLPPAEEGPDRHEPEEEGK